MVIKHFTFIPDDTYLINARPGSPHPFFSMMASASPSPDACTNCIGSFNSATHRRSSSAPVQDMRARDKAEAEAEAAETEVVDEITAQISIHRILEEIYDEADPAFGSRASVLAFWRRMSRRRRLQSCLFKTPGEDLQFGRLKRFSLHELQLATKRFSPENILEIGAFGNVYKGCLGDGSLVAVKRLKVEYPWGRELQLFQTELLMSRLADHQNLLGFCITPTERLLIYPYMATVASLLGATKRQYSQPHLGWPTRKQIAMGAARGLRYLHEQCDFKIVHSDVHSSNILLDENFEAAVGNLGLAKFMDHKDTLITTPICGTAGCLAPEFISKGELSEKTDVFCYGVMLLELVTGQSYLALDLVACQEPVMLLDWVKGPLRKRRSDINPGDYVKDEVEQLIRVALMCTQVNAMDRPRMSEVVDMLEQEALAKRYGRSGSRRK